MRRQVFISFMIWFCSCMVGFFLFYRFYLDGPVTGEVIQTMILAFLTGLNFFYLFYILYKIDVEAAVIFTAIYGLVFGIGYFVYDRFFKDMDVRLKFAQLLGGLMITTVVVHVVRRRRASR